MCLSAVYLTIAACRSATYKATIPYITRPAREGEVDGVNYNFITNAQFKSMQNAGRFVEWGERQGVFYGTSAEAPAIKPTGFGRQSSRTVRAMAKVGMVTSGRCLGASHCMGRRSAWVLVSLDTVLMVLWL